MGGQTVKVDVPGLGIVEFPQGTDPSVMQRAIASQLRPMNIDAATAPLDTSKPAKPSQAPPAWLDANKDLRNNLPLVAGGAATMLTGGMAALPAIALTGLAGAAGSVARREMGGGDTSVDPATEAAQSFVGQAAPVGVVRGLKAIAPAVQRGAGSIWSYAAKSGEGIKPSPEAASEVLNRGRGVLNAKNADALVNEASINQPIDYTYSEKLANAPGPGPTTIPRPQPTVLSDAADAHLSATQRTGGIPRLAGDMAQGGAGTLAGEIASQWAGPYAPAVGTAIGAIKVGTNPLVQSAMAQGIHSTAGIVASHPTESAMIAQIIHDQIAKLIGGSQPQPQR